MFSDMLDVFKETVQCFSELTLLKEIFQRNDYAENCIDRRFKLFLNRIRIVKEKVPAVEKKSLRLVLPFVGTISLQTRTKLQKSSKRVFTEVNYKLFSKVKINSVILFASKTLIHKFIQQVWCTSFSVDYVMRMIDNLLDTLL